MRLNKTLAAAVVAALSGAFVTTAGAHESRNVPATDTPGKLFRLTAGFAVEPAYEDSDNAIDFFVNAYDGKEANGFDIITASVNRKVTNNVVKLKVTALYLDKDAPLDQAKILAQKVIADDTDADPSNDTSLPFGETNVYRTHFRPTHPGAPQAGGGAYAFHVEGLLNWPGGPADPVCTNADCSETVTPDVAARSGTIDEYFICGNGHAPTDANHSGKYNCVQVLPSFPGNPGDGYKPNNYLKAAQPR